jgi:hypothetical protein
MSGTYTTTGYKSNATNTATSQSDETILQSFLSRIVTAGTAQSYQPGIRRWKSYIDTLDTKHNIDEFLVSVDDDNDKARRIVLFMAYLFMEDGLRDSAGNSCSIISFQHPWKTNWVLSTSNRQQRKSIRFCQYAWM